MNVYFPFSEREKKSLLYEEYFVETQNAGSKIISKRREKPKITHYTAFPPVPPSPTTALSPLPPSPTIAPFTLPPSSPIPLLPLFLPHLLSLPPPPSLASSLCRCRRHSNRHKRDSSRPPPLIKSSVSPGRG